MDNLYFVWLQSFAKIDYLNYIKLKKVFKSAKNIYESSKDKEKFLKAIKENNIYLSKNFISRLVSESLKEQAKSCILNLIQNNIFILTIYSKNYPYSLKNIYNPPLVIYAYGDKSLLYNIKVYMYNNNFFSNYGKYVYKDFSNYLFKNKISLVSDNLDENTNIYFCKSIQKIKRDNLLVISSNIDIKSILNYDYVMGISDLMFIPEASYNLKIYIYTELMLEQGKDIYVVPGNIYNLESYFSNYLIQNGANVVTGKFEFITKIKK